MKRTLMVCAVLAAITAGVHAKETRKSKEPPPPAAAPAEVDDVRMGPEIGEACLSTPIVGETYDGLDNVLIADTSEGSPVFLRLKGDCSFNTLMFARSIAPKASGSCLGEGDAIVVSDSFDAPHECVVVQINEWDPEKDYLPDAESSQSY